MQNKLFKKIVDRFNSTDRDIVMAVAFTIFVAMFFALFLYCGVQMGLAYKSGYWVANVTTTYNAVSFIAMESGLLFVTVLVAVPCVVCALFYYFMYLQKRISKLEKLAEEKKNE